VSFFRHETGQVVSLSDDADADADADAKGDDETVMP